MHVEAERAVVDLGGADLHQLVPAPGRGPSGRRRPAGSSPCRPRGRAWPTPGGGRLGGVLRGRRVAVVVWPSSRRLCVVMPSTLGAKQPRGMVHFHGGILGHFGHRPASGADRSGPAPRADRRPARGRALRPAGPRHPAAVLPLARRRPGHRPQHGRRRLRRPGRRGLAHRPAGLGHPGRRAGGRPAGRARRPATRAARARPAYDLRPGSPDLALLPARGSGSRPPAAPSPPPRTRPSATATPVAARSCGPHSPATSPAPGACAPTPNGSWCAPGSRTA